MRFPFLKCSLMAIAIWLLSCPSVLSQNQTSGNVNAGPSGAVKLPGSINNGQDKNWAPSVTADGKLMVFESERSGKMMIFESGLEDNGTWSQPRSIDSINYFCDSTGIEGPFISYDGNQIYFSMPSKGNIGNEDIYCSDRKQDYWSKPFKLSPDINTPEYEGYPSVSSDGGTLYFNRVKKDFKDKNFTGTCYVLYYARKDPEGKWQTPEPVPYPVNLHCDKAPRILPDNHTLIYSSFRPGSAGNYDLYESKVNTDGEWSDPEPLTFLNTQQDDQLVTVPAEGKILYFNSGNDLWSYPIPEKFQPQKTIMVQGIIKDADSGKGIGAEISVSDKATTGEVMTLHSNEETGRYSLVVQTGKNYQVEIRKPGYSVNTFALDLRPVTKYKVISKDAGLFHTVKLELKAQDADLSLPLPANITVINRNTGNTVFSGKLDTLKNFLRMELPLGGVYEIKGSLENFSSQSLEINLDRPVCFMDMEETLKLTQKKINVPVNISDITTGSKVDGHITCTDLSRAETLELNSNEMVSLRIGDTYEIEAFADKGYFFGLARIEVQGSGLKLLNVSSPGAAQVEGGNLEFRLTSLARNSILILSDVRFDKNTSRLLQSSYQPLDMMTKLLILYPTLRLEIDGNTDNYESASYDMALSQKQAQCVADYFISNSISGKRLKAAGFGNAHPVNTTNPEENGSGNNRIEFKVLEYLN